MAIETKPRTRYVVWTLGFGVVCLVFGLWGAYDFFITIPRQAELVRHVEVLDEAKTALEKEDGFSGPLSEQALQTIVEERNKYDKDEAAVDEDALPYVHALNAAGRALTPPRSGETAQQYAARRSTDLNAIREHLNSPAYRDLEPPSTFDRVVQVAYISCLLCVPFFVMGYLKTKKQRYVLDDEGNLTLPDGTWAAEDIADIDMSAWMKKSVAHVVHTNGTRVLLDDYKHEDLHLIIGALAHRFYPDEWQEDARRVGADDEDEDEVEGVDEDVDDDVDVEEMDADETAEPEEVERH